jgi:hypothetical protein
MKAATANASLDIARATNAAARRASIAYFGEWTETAPSTTAAAAAAAITAVLAVSSGVGRE